MKTTYEQRKSEEPDRSPGYAKVPLGGTFGLARWWWILLAVSVLGFVLRVVHIEATAQMPSIRHLIGDAAGYYSWASRIAAGNWRGTESFYQAPLYPYVLATCMKVFSSDVATLRMVQAIWGGVGVALLGFAAMRMFDKRVGLLAALMLATYAPAIFFDGIVQKASLGSLLICALLSAMCIAVGHHSRNRQLVSFAICGVISGLLILTRENAMLWLPILGVWALSQRPSEKQRSCRDLDASADRLTARSIRRRRIGSSLALGVGVALVLGPVAARNARVGGEWSMSTFQAGPNFFIGNSAEADGRYRPLVRGHETPEFERRDAVALAEADLDRSLSSREVSRYWLSRAAADIANDPLRWLGLLARKTWMVWNRYEVADAESQYVYADQSTVLRVLGYTGQFGVLCPLAIVGVILTWTKRRDLWVYYLMILSMAASVALFYVMARYRYPLVPLLIPFAAAGCVGVWDRVRTRQAHKLGPSLLIGLLVGVAVNYPIHDERRLDAMAWMNVGVALAQDGDIPGATVYFRRAVADQPESAEASNNLAQALALQQQYEEAIIYYEKAIAVEAELLGVHYNLGVALERIGRLEAARTSYGTALLLDAADDDARRALARLGHN